MKANKEMDERSDIMVRLQEKNKRMERLRRSLSQMSQMATPDGFGAAQSMLMSPIPEGMLLSLPIYVTEQLSRVK